MRNLETLAVSGDANRPIPLARAAETLGMPESTIRRYFWGYKSKKGGPRINKAAAMSTEDAITLGIKSAKAAASQPKPIVEKSKVNVPPCKENAAPLHATRTAHGIAAIYDFGDGTVTGLTADWEWKPHGVADAKPVILRPGMRGRHVFGRTSKELADRCFEWSVSVGKTNHLKPSFEISEFKLGGFGLREFKKPVCASTPNQLWNKLFLHLGLLEPRHGAQLCGFHDPNVAVMSQAHAHQTTYGLCKGLGSMTHRWTEHMVASLNGRFKQLLKSVCPSDPQSAWVLLRDSAAFQAAWSDL